MTNPTVESLLAWMRNPAHEMLWGWDCIAAMARGKTNQILIQDYVARFHSGSYLPAISGEVMMAGNDFKEAIHDFVLDAPHLSFAASGLNDAKASLTMSVISGVQLGLRKDGNVWQTVRLSEIDPLQGPALSLDLDLNEVPGIVGDNGQVRLDLRHSDNFNLNFALTEEAQRQGGEFFKEKFNQLPDEQRVFVLGVIEPGGEAALQPQSFRLRAQRKAGLALAATAEEDAEGAILVFICMAGSLEGGSPDSAYPYLIPSDAARDYSATVLFSKNRLEHAAVASVVRSCMQLVGTNDFDYVHDANGKLLSASANAGALFIEPFIKTLVPVEWNGKRLMTRFECGSASLPAHSRVPLTLVVHEGNNFLIEWDTNGSIETAVLMSTEGHPEQRVDLGRQEISVHLEAGYRLSEVEGNLVLQPTAWKLDVDREEPGAVAGAYPDEMVVFVILFVLAQVALTMATLIEPRLKQVLGREFKLDAPIGEFLKDSIQLNFGRAIQTDTLHLPRDVAAFGHIHPGLSTFEITPWKPMIRAGGRQLIAVQPDTKGLDWAVEGLQRSALDPGGIDRYGVYSAPSAEAFEGRFLRVRITATDPASGYQAAALVTVVREPLAINPLIQECAKGGAVQLQAGVIGEGSLEWSILDPVAEQSGRLTVHDDNGRTCTYTATSQSIPGQTYVLDTIEVHVLNSGARRSVQVLVVLAPPSLSISVVTDATLPAGQVRLQVGLEVGTATPKNVHWYLPLGGPGELDPITGVYIPDTAALPRFVLVMARYEIAGLILEGHLLRPLPLAELT
ncbi:hypothetical protein PS3A_18810 [Pseudomonas sp. 3A(2025)]